MYISEDAYCYLGTRRKIPNSKVFAWENCIAYVSEDAYCYLSKRRNIPNSKVFAGEVCIAYISDDAYCYLSTRRKIPNSKYLRGKITLHIFRGMRLLLPWYTRRKIPNSKVFAWESCIAHILEDANNATLVQGEKFKFEHICVGNLHCVNFRGCLLLPQLLQGEKFQSICVGRLHCVYFRGCVLLPRPWILHNIIYLRASPKWPPLGGF